MQLDQTHVVVRKRLQTEIADLALVMIRQYPSALFVGLALGAMPWAVANWILIGWIPIREAEFGLGDQDAARELYRYVAWMVLLVVAQAPAAGAWTTYFLGQAVFERRPTWSTVRAEVRRQFPTWFWRLGVLRLPIPIMILLAFRLGEPFDVGYDVILYFAVFAWIGAVRSSRPFLPEVILLEQCPPRSDDPALVSLPRRMTLLHRPMAGELTSRMFSVCLGAMIAVVAIFYTLSYLRGIALGQWERDVFAYLVFLPASLWLVAMMCVFHRLLNYLDTRIRMEGWEVELAVRAEEVRQFPELQTPDGMSSGAKQVVN